MSFELSAKAENTLARSGKIKTAHGVIETPAFMPIATYGAVKTLTSREIKMIGYELILSNTYHLYLRPGHQLISELGGIHQWMNWNGAVLTDSGGYQAFSLSRKNNLAKTTEEGVAFQSIWDGSSHFFTPKSVIDIQWALGSDIVMVLDDCPPYPSDNQRLAQAITRTRQWANESIDYWRSKDRGERLIFGIVQGGCNEKLRLQSLNDIQVHDFDGIAIGGVSVGEGKEKMFESVDYLADKLDKQRPHYLMGVGDPLDLINMVSRGIDLFDCVLPTRLARHGAFWVQGSYERYNIRESRFIKDAKPLDEKCNCEYCRSYSRSYLRSMFINGETMALRALSYHNLYLIQQLMKDIQKSIKNDTFFTQFKTLLR